MLKGKLIDAFAYAVAIAFYGILIYALYLIKLHLIGPV